MKVSWEEFVREVKAAKLRPRDCGKGHWRVEGGKFEVNWWPNSKKGTVYVNGLCKGNSSRNGTIQDVIRMANEDPEIKPREKRGLRKRSYRRMREFLLRTTLPLCHWCDCRLNEETATLDHLIPLARGGSNATDNLVLSCGPCNKEKGNKIAP